MPRVSSCFYTISGKTRTLIIETQSDSDQDDLEEIIHNHEGDTWENDFDVDQAATLGCLLRMHPSLIDNVDGVTCRLSVVRCALTQPKESDDWRKSSNFQTLTKTNGKNCRVIIDSESCISIVTSGMMTKFGLKNVRHL